MKNSRKKEMILNLFIIIITSLLMFAAAEMVVRLLYKDTIVMYPRYTTSAQYDDFKIRRIQPSITFNHADVDGHWIFQTNREGFRNLHDFDVQKKLGVLRIAAIGDSHTQGYEVHQNNTFSSVIQNKLMAKGIKAEVMNTGVSGFSTAEELILLDHGLRKYNPDVIVLGFFANDYNDNMKTGLFTLNTAGELELTKKVYLPGVAIQDAIYTIPGIRWLSENSYFYSFLFNQTWVYFKTRLSRSNQVEYAVKNTQALPMEEALTNELLKELCQVSHNIGAKLVILDIPQASTVDNAIEKSSMLPSTMRVAQQCADAVLSKETFNEFLGIHVLHVPHGHHHLSEVGHALFGVAVAERIMTLQSMTVR